MLTCLSNWPKQTKLTSGLAAGSRACAPPPSCDWHTKPDRCAPVGDGRPLAPSPNRAPQPRNAIRLLLRIWAKFSRKAKRCCGKETWNGAEAAFAQVLAADPASAGAYANLGVIAMRRQQWTKALELLTQAEKLAPQVAGIRLNIGLVYYRQDDFQAATAPFESVVRDQPDSVQARYLLGLCYFFTSRDADAVRVLNDLWPQEWNDLNFLYVLGNAANKSGHADIEERALGRFVELGANTAEYHLTAGQSRAEPRGRRQSHCRISAGGRNSIRICRTCTSISAWLIWRAPNLNRPAMNF